MRTHKLRWLIALACVSGTTALSRGGEEDAGRVLFRDAFVDTSRWTWLSGKAGHPGWYLQEGHLAYWHPYSVGTAIAEGMPVASDAEIEVDMWLQAYRGHGRAGVYFRWDGRNGYLLSLSKARRLVLQRVGLLAGPVARASVDGGWSAQEGNPGWEKRLSRVRVRAAGPRLRCYIDGQLLIDVIDSAYEEGRVGFFSAFSHCWFGDLSVCEPE